MKSEPSVFSIEDLRRKKTTCWDGVRNYQARNFMRDQMHVGDEVLFYHSNATPSGIAGLATIVKEAYGDFTAWDPGNIHYDPKARPDRPTWMMVDVRFVRACREIIALEDLRKIEALSAMGVLRKGNRLSILPVDPREWTVIMKLPQWLSKSRASAG